MGFSTYLPGWASATAIKIDDAQNVYISGNTVLSMPITPGAFQTTHSGTNDAYVLKFNASGTQIILLHLFRRK